MGLFDDAVPGGNVGKPIIIALGALLVSKFLSDRSKEKEPQGEETAQGEDGGLLGGLDGLLDKLRNAGQGEKADSWVGTGENKPIESNELGKALGPNVIKELAQKTGMSEEELLKQLSAALPGMVDKLTPGGATPTQAQVSSALRT